MLQKKVSPWMHAHSVAVRRCFSDNKLEVMYTDDYCTAKGNDACKHVGHCQTAIALVQPVVLRSPRGPSFSAWLSVLEHKSVAAVVFGQDDGNEQTIGEDENLG